MTQRQRHRWLRIRDMVLCAAVFTMSLPASAEWNEKVLYSFQGLPDGANPVGGIAFDTAGNLYGATTDGGSKNCPGIAACGTVFQLKPPARKGGTWSESVIYVFKGKNSNDGETPGGGVIFDKAGNLYGTASYGGSGNCVLLGVKVGCGVVYKLTPPKQKGGAWSESVIYSFRGGKDGYLPNGDLTFDAAGNLYGATLFGGGKGTTCDPFYQYCGTVFKVSPPKAKGGKWTEQVLHSFARGADGANPNGGLTLDSKGAIYGTTPVGGNQLCDFGHGNVGCGVLFKLTPPLKGGGAWTETILHRFTLGKDGAGPNGGLIFDSTGSLYGTAATGGDAQGYGVGFRFTPTGDGHWSETILHEFTGGKDGQGPGTGFVSGGAGQLYGTSIGGPLNSGVVFRLKPTVRTSAWSFSVLYSFKGVPDGKLPKAPLILGFSGSLYGTAGGGKDSSGCVFEVWP
jgi:hypothetical protein